MRSHLLFGPFLFFLVALSLGGCARTSTRDAGVTDGALSDAIAVSDAMSAEDASAPDVVCLTLSRPTGSCDLERGACCEASTECVRGFCRYPGWMCSGDMEHCIDGQDCCNGRHSCIGNACQY